MNGMSHTEYMRGWRHGKEEQLNAQARRRRSELGSLARYRTRRSEAASDPLTIAARFWSKVDLAGPLPASPPDLGVCYVWQGGTDRPGGYGVFWVGGRLVKAARYALSLAGIELGAAFACHHCDNSVCVRPSHLFAGTQSDNMRDMVAKGRQGGLGHGKAVAK